MRLLVLIFSFLLSTATADAEPLKPDISLIRLWDQNFYRNHPYQPFPKVIRYEGERTLTFVATKHRDWKSSQERIRKAIDDFKPDIILIEGIAKSDGLSPRIWDEKIKQDLNVEGYEGYFAYKLALERKIPFVGAELEGRMSDHSSYERDIAVVTYTAELLNKHKNVMTIYGAGHFVQQEAVLTKMLGSPQLLP